MFDHAVLPTTSTGSPSSGSFVLPPGMQQLVRSDSRLHYGDMLGREATALYLISDLVTFCANGEGKNGETSVRVPGTAVKKDIRVQQCCYMLWQ